MNDLTEAFNCSEELSVYSPKLFNTLDKKVLIKVLKMSKEFNIRNFSFELYSRGLIEIKRNSTEQLSSVRSLIILIFRAAALLIFKI